MHVRNRSLPKRRRRIRERSSKRQNKNRRKNDKSLRGTRSSEKKAEEK